MRISVDSKGARGHHGPRQITRASTAGMRTATQAPPPDRSWLVELPDAGVFVLIPEESTTAEQTEALVVSIINGGPE